MTRTAPNDTSAPHARSPTQVPPQIISDYAEMYLWRQWAMHSVADRVAWAACIA